MRSLAAFAVLLTLAVSASGQAQLGPVRTLPGDLAEAPAVKLQNAPSVAAGAGGFLAVWQDQRTALGVTAADSQDVFAARLDAAGRLIDRKPIVISNQANEQGVPRVSWNGRHWLVAFLTVRPGDARSEDLVAVRVAPDGAVVDAAPRVLRAQDGSKQISNLAVASDGSGWAVVWEEFNAAGVRGVEGVRVEGDGTVGISTPIWYDASNTYAHDADIAFAADRFLVTWARGSSELVALRVTTSLARLDAAPVRLNDYAFSGAERPSVAGNSADFLVAWHEMVNSTNSQVFAARVSREGAVLDPAGIPLGGATSGDLTPAAAWNGFEYVIAYTQGDRNLYHQRVGADGRRIDAAPVLVAAAAGEPAAASPGGGAAQVVYASRTDVSARQVTPEGGVTGAVLVSLDRPRQSGVRFASHPSGHLAVFLSEISGQTRILAQRLDLAGNALDAEPRLVASGAEGKLLRQDVAWNGSVYLVVWEGPGGIFGRRLAADGSPLDAAPRLLLPHASSVQPWSRPAVGALGSDFLLVATEFRGSTMEDSNWLKGVRVSAAGQVLDAPFLIRAGYELDSRVVALGNRWLVVFASRSISSPSSTIRAAFVSAAGVPEADFHFVETGAGLEPDVAVQGDTALVVWQDNGTYSDPKIDARLLKADGTFLSGDIQVEQGPWQQAAPAVTLDGAGGWVVSWVDYRTTPPPGQQRGDIWLARVGASGAVNQTTQVTAGPLPEQQPRLAPLPETPGAALLAYSALDPVNFRIALRTVGPGGSEPPPPPPPAPAVASLTLDPASVVGGKGSTATVTLAQPAPSEGARVMLSSSNVNAATVPVSVTVPAGATSRTFAVSTKPVASSTMVSIAAAYGGSGKAAVLTVQAPAVSGLTLSPSTIAGGCQGSTGKVTLSGKAPAGGLVVPLSNTNPAASVPASVTVPAGATYATFPVTAPAVTSLQTGTVSASFGGVTKSVTLKVRPIGVASLALSPNPVVGPGSVAGTVTLECPAAPGSVTVALSSTTTSVARPAVASVTIPAGSTAATFTVTTADVSAVSYATIRAATGGVTKSVRLTVNP